MGLANCTVDELRRAHAVHPISAIEVEWSLCARHNEVIPLTASVRLGPGGDSRSQLDSTINFRTLLVSMGRLCDLIRTCGRTIQTAYK